MTIGMQSEDVSLQDALSKSMKAVRRVHGSVDDPKTCAKGRTPVKYLLLIAGDENRLNHLPEPEASQRHQNWGTYTSELLAANKMRGGERLRPAATATTLRLNGSGRLLSDGPFAETKEQLGGFYVVEAKDLDEAVELASKMPHLADGGAVEIRPIWELS